MQDPFRLTRHSTSLLNHWFIVFTPPSPDAFWWQRIFTNERMGHVLLVKQVTHTHGIIYDPLNAYGSLNLYEFEQGLPQAMGRLAVDLPVFSFIHLPESFWNITSLIPSCVTLCKYKLGLNSRAVTPAQFYKCLEAHPSAKRI